MTSGCPPRPSGERPGDTGFTRQEMVRWLSPRELVSAGLRVLLSGIFGTYADKREIQAALERPEPHDASGGPEMWVDYVSDLGDGFNPTYALASLLAQEKLELAAGAGSPFLTRRGGILVMGGDEVYPTAATEEYRDRLVGPYRAALPCTAPPDHPQLFAIPGNHDWYDGLTAFMRAFCQGRWIGGWQIPQRRSYFAVALPHRWWLWGIDIQFDTYIDEPQLAYFRDVVGPHVRPGDSVILCSAKPNWVEANEGSPDAYATLDFFERSVVRERGASVRLSLTGDSHHYARYQEAGGTAQRITAGGGGAFLSATHHLPDRLLLPPPQSTDPGRTTPPAEFRLAAAYPSKRESRRVARGVVALPRKNPSFAGLMAAVHVLFAWMIQSAIREPGETFAGALHGASLGDVAAGLARSPVAMVVSVLLLVGMAGFTKAASRAVKWGLGAPHTVAHLAAVVVVAWAAELPLSQVDGVPFLAGYLALVALSGGLLGSLVMAGYLFLADKAGCNTNELFAAQRIEHKKSFLRLHVGDDGVLTVYPVKVERVPTDWQLRAGGAPGDPWFTAVGTPPLPELIEDPIRIPPAAAP